MSEGLIRTVGSESDGLQLVSSGVEMTTQQVLDARVYSSELTVSGVAVKSTTHEV